MNAIVYNRYGPPEELCLKELPRPEPQRHEVLVEVHAAGINPKDCMVRKGKYRWFTGRKFPQIPGYDVAGIVVATGEAVKDFQPGDAVLGMVNGWKGGAYAEYMTLPASGLARKPANITFEEAAAVPMAGQTALQALRDIGKIKAGHIVIINGASGGVGTFAVQIAKTLGARVTAVCSHRNIELMHQLDADATIDYTQRDVLETAQQCDIFFDVFGNKSFSGVRPLLKWRGIYISTLPKLRNFRDAALTYLSPGKRARVVIVTSRRQDLALLAGWVESGKVRPVLDRVYPLRAVADAHRYLETKRARGKVVLQIR